ncbi:MAG: zinc-ribbon domain-containing protein [Proteobacteria bacterium]|nr:zinc-ribbon domain-containing protein [Pseudomonadota bacterium]
MIISCPTCQTKYKLNLIDSPKKEVFVTCKKCNHRFSLNLKNEEKTENIKILVAHDDFRVINIIKKLLEKMSFNIITADNGMSAYSVIENEKPEIAIIDVALPGMFGFELCEKIKNNPMTKNTKIILVASIYDRTRYKRKPQNLYGADDYIEKHHIPDELITKILNLTSAPIRSKEVVNEIKKDIPKDNLKDNRDILLEDANINKIIDKERETIKHAENKYIANTNSVDEKAKRLARLIVSDIALYNQEIIKKVTINNYSELLKLDVTDGISHLKSRVPEISYKAEEYIHNAFIELLKKEI